DDGAKQRVRAASFADHFTQARLFWISQTRPEQDHIVNGFAFELAKVETVAIRRRMLGQLENVHRDLALQVASALGMEGEADSIAPARPPGHHGEASPALSLVAKAPETIAGRKIGLLLSDGADDELVASIRERVAAEGARVVVVAPKVAGVTSK